MAYIVEFTIEGLVGRNDFYNQKLNKDVNVFFGLNGSGKTSLLKILHSAMDDNSSILEDVPFRSAEIKVYSEQFKSVFKYSINKGRKREESEKIGDMLSKAETIEMRYAKALLNKNFLKWKIDPQIRNLRRCSHRYLPTSRLWSSIPDELMIDWPKKEGKLFEFEAYLDKNFESSMNLLWNEYNASILGNIRKAQEEGLTKILQGILAPESSQGLNDIIDIKNAYERAKSFLTRRGVQKVLGSLNEFADSYSKDIVLKSIVNIINKVELIIEKESEPRKILENLITGLFSGNKHIKFSDTGIDVTSDKNAQIRLASLSSGEKQILCILIGCLMVDVGVVLIDEPEISMHVDWQKDLIASMRSVNPDAQLILATHSPEIMATIHDDKIFRL